MMLRLDYRGIWKKVWVVAVCGVLSVGVSACSDDDSAGNINDDAGSNVADGSGLDSAVDSGVEDDGTAPVDGGDDSGVPPECTTSEDCDWMDPGQCEVAECDTETGTCQLADAPDNTPCDDGDGLTCNETCQQGTCTPGSCDEPATVMGRVWNYYVSGSDLEYDYPMDQITVGAYTDAATSLAEVLTDVDSCTPWDPSDPYMCGTWSMELMAGWDVMYKASYSYDNGYWDTLTQIYPVADGDTRVIVMAHSDIIDLVSTMWGVTVDPDKGHVFGVVATTNNDIGEPPFDQWIGEATVEIAPSGELGNDYVLVYYDEADPSNMTRTNTDPNSSFFVALNVPPRPYESPYEINVSHGTETFSPVRFAVQADVLTYLILPPDTTP